MEQIGLQPRQADLVPVLALALTVRHVQPTDVDDHIRICTSGDEEGAMAA